PDPAQPPRPPRTPVPPSSDSTVQEDGAAGIEPATPELRRRLRRSHSRAAHSWPRDGPYSVRNLLGYRTIPACDAPATASGWMAFAAGTRSTAPRSTRALRSSFELVVSPRRIACISENWASVNGNGSSPQTFAW